MAENKGYMQYAMLFGTYLGGYWILKFILFPLGLTIPFLSFLFVGLTLCVPFMGYYYVRMYRNTVCSGSISFLHAWIRIGIAPISLLGNNAPDYHKVFNFEIR